MCIGDATSEGEPQWFVRSTPASDLQLALARRTADAALHTALAVDRNAAHIAWIRVLQVAYLDICTLFRSWGEIRGSENQLLQGAGVERLELTCGLDGAGIHLSTLMTVQLIHLIQNKSSWFVDAVAAAREAWPETVAEWRVDARVAQHVQASASAFEFQLTDPTVRDILVLLAEAGIPVDVSPRQFLSNITGG
ncbi:hypothetical protein BC828DRAFT_382475 [Blastocladiella britannica]|nr:hypothetical protein BC828DRAFT_382475 [Blastocladiella britannica]